MGRYGEAIRARWPAVAGVGLVAAASLAAGGCAGSHHPAKALACPPGSSAGSGAGAAGGSGAPAPAGKANPAVAAGWALPGGNQQNTRDVAGPMIDGLFPPAQCESPRRVPIQTDSSESL